MSSAYAKSLQFLVAVSTLLLFRCSKIPTGVHRGAELVTRFDINPGPQTRKTNLEAAPPFESEAERSSNARLSRDRNHLLVYFEWAPPEYVAIDLRFRGTTGEHIRGRFGDEMWKGGLPVKLARKFGGDLVVPCPDLIDGVSIQWPRRPDHLYSHEGRIIVSGKGVALRGRYAYECEGAVSQSRKYFSVRSLSDPPGGGGVFPRHPSFRFFQIFDLSNLEERFAQTFARDNNRTAKFEGWLDGSTYVFVYEGSYIDARQSVEVQVIHLD